MEFFKAVRDLTIIILGTAYFAFVGQVTYKLGKSAIDLHEHGMFNLAKWNIRN